MKLPVLFFGVAMATLTTVSSASTRRFDNQLNWQVYEYWQPIAQIDYRGRSVECGAGDYLVKLSVNSRNEVENAKMVISGPSLELHQNPKTFETECGARLDLFSADGIFGSPSADQSLQRFGCRTYVSYLKVYTKILVDHTGVARAFIYRTPEYETGNGPDQVIAVNKCVVN